MARRNLEPGELTRGSQAFAQPVSRSRRSRCWVLPLPDGPCSAPPSCACCGAPSSSEVELARGVRSLLIAYCEACAAHVARAGTQLLAARLASAIAGLAACFALPVFLPWSSVLSCSSIVLFAAVLPFAGWLFPVRVTPPHTSSGRAVWFWAQREVACTREAFANEFAGRAGVSCEGRERARSLPRVELLCILLLASVATPISHAYQHPSLRILNLGDVPCELMADGKRLARVEPSSGESPFAGVEVNLPAGSRTLTSYDLSGKLLESLEVEVRAGEHHLYAQSAEDTCFWLETRGYGRGSQKTHYEPLLGSQRFWVIPDDVHGWFVPPSEASPDMNVTGGHARVLRQARCRDAPLSH